MRRLGKAASPLSGNGTESPCGAGTLSRISVQLLYDLRTTIAEDTLVIGSAVFSRVTDCSTLCHSPSEPQ